VPLYAVDAHTQALTDPFAGHAFQNQKKNFPAA
jgi:hypothetical protein